MGCAPYGLSLLDYGLDGTPRLIGYNEIDAFGEHNSLAAADAFQEGDSTPRHIVYTKTGVFAVKLYHQTSLNDGYGKWLCSDKADGVLTGGYLYGIGGFGKYAQPASLHCV